MGKSHICGTCAEKFESRRQYKRHVEKKNCEANIDGFEERKEMEDRSNPVSNRFSSMYFGESSTTGFRTESDHDDSISDKESDSDDVEDEEEIEVIKSNIFKYHGDLTYDQQLSSDILHFEYYDDFNDDEDVVIIEEDDPELTESMDSNMNDAQNTFVCCEECGDLFVATELDEHKEIQHPPKKKNIQQFGNGNFLMLA